MRLRSGAISLLVLLSVCGIHGCKKGAEEPAAISQKHPKGPPTTRKANAKWAERLFDQAKYEDAITEASQVLLGEPQNSLALLTLGRSFSAKGDHNAAMDALRSIPENDLLYGITAKELMIDLSIKAGPWDDAEKWMRSVLASQPKNHKIRAKLAGLMNLCGRRYEACREMEHRLANEKLDIQSLLLLLDPTEPMDTRKWAQSILKRFPNDSLASLALANYALFTQEYDTAIPLYESIIKSNRIPSGYANLALAYARTERWNQLNSLVRTAPAEISRFPSVWIAVGTMFESQQMYPEAIKAYLMTLDTYNAEPEALRGLVRTLTANGQDDAARIVANQITHCTSIGDRLKRLSREIDDQDNIIKLANDLQFFGRDAEALGWLIYAWEHGDQTATLTESIRNLQTRLASAPAKKTQFASATEHWPKQVAAISKIAPIEMSSVGSQVSSDQQSFIRFHDIANEVGVKFVHDMGPIQNNSINVYQTNGTGIAAIDFNLDGWIDLYLPQAGGIPLQHSEDRRNLFYQNIDGKHATDIYRCTGLDVDAWGQGAAVGDIDGDGMPDLFLPCYGESTLWQNHGDGTFCKCKLPLTRSDRESMSTSAAVADVNGDSLPDIIETNYSDLKTVMSKVCYAAKGVIKSCSPTEFVSASDRIYINNGDWTFASANDRWNLPIEGGRGYGIVVGNFDRRNGNDVYIANDMNANHYLISCESVDGDVEKYRLYDESALSGLSVDSQGRSQGSMGIAVGDLNRDGLLDMFVTNFYDEFNVVYTGIRGGIFNDATTKFQMSYANKKTLGFGTQAIDFDRDGYLDLAILNGHVDDFSFEGTPYKMPAEIFVGSPNGFSLLSGQQLGPYFSELTLGRALATLDWDRDLKVDLVANHLDRPLAILRNETTTTNHSVQFELVGTASDRDATGSYVEIHAGKERWTTSLVRGSGYECSNEPLLDLGIGDHATIDKVVVTWPNNQTQEFSNLESNTRYLLVEGQYEAWPRESITQ